MLSRCPECHSKKLVPIVYFNPTGGLERFPQDEQALQKAAEKSLLMTYPPQHYPPVTRQRKKDEVLLKLREEISRETKSVEETRQELREKEAAGKLVARRVPSETRQRRDLHCISCGRDWTLAETSPNGNAQESKNSSTPPLQQTLRLYSDMVASTTTWSDSGAGMTYPGSLSAAYYTGSLAVGIVSSIAGNLVYNKGHLNIRERGPQPFYETAKEIIETSEEVRGKFLSLVDEDALANNKTNALIWRPKTTDKEHRMTIQEELLSDQEVVEISIGALKCCVEAVHLIQRLLGYDDFWTNTVVSLDYAFRLLDATFKSVCSETIGVVTRPRDPRVMGDWHRMGIDLEEVESYDNRTSTLVKDLSKEFEGLAGETEAMLKAARDKAVVRERTIIF